MSSESKLNSAKEKQSETLELLKLQLADSCERVSRANQTSAPEFTSAGNLQFQRLSFLAEAVLSDASDLFLKRTSNKTLSDIVCHSQSAIQQYLSSAKSFHISLEKQQQDLEGSDYIALFVVMGNRPLIVDSITELIHEYKLEMRTVICPAFELGSLPAFNADDDISLTYLELSHTHDEEKLEAFLQRLEVMLADLIIVTDDFPQMLGKCAAITSGLRSSAASKLQDQDSGASPSEVADFLDYLISQNYIFLGHREWIISKNKAGKTRVEHLSDQDLGIFRSNNPEYNVLEDTSREAKFLAETENLFLYSRFYLKSRIHRNQRMNIVSFKSVCPTSGEIRIHSFIGLVRYFFLQQYADTAPYSRIKMENVLQLDDIEPATHHDREIRSIYRGLPRIRLLQMGTERIREDIEMIQVAKQTGDTLCNFYVDVLKRFISIVVVMPRYRYSGETRTEIQSMLEDAYGIPRGSADHYVIIVDHRLLRVQFLLPKLSPEQEFLPELVDTEAISQKMRKMTFTWQDRLTKILQKEHGRSRAKVLAKECAKTFPPEYQSLNSPEVAVYELEKLREVAQDKALELSIIELPQTETASSDSSEEFSLNIYSKANIVSLSWLFPVLQNAGLEVLHQYPVTANMHEQDLQVHKLRVRVRDVIEQHPAFIREESAQASLLSGLKRILAGEVANDQLNRLLARPGFSIDDIVILRMLTQYIRQNTSYSASVLENTLIENSNLARLIIDIFHAKFDPDVDGNAAKRAENLRRLARDFAKRLKSVSNLLDDNVLRTVFGTVLAAERTNYYQYTRSSALSIKFSAKRLPQITSTSSVEYETFVFSPRFQGIYLRSGKVSRGSIYLSERIDYRREAENLLRGEFDSVIVPESAKGALYLYKSFGVAHQLAADVKTDSVEEYFENFVRALLDITDNILDGGKVLHPQRTIVYDGEDPYLVIAPDAGTSQFVDKANTIATEEYGYWLGDGFCAGGATGYELRKIGMAARGMWVSINHHLRTIGIESEKSTLNLVGIGDLSDDVFGYALAEKRNVRLIAAFSDKYIFLDPTPDLEVAHRERQRLFALPQSDWIDYNSELISEGGGVFSRTEKEITLPENARRVLGVKESRLSADSLIKAILCAPVDVLVTTGIGQYVIASDEVPSRIDDREDKDIRVLARDLRSKVVGESAIQGFSQRARVEYARIGGRLNSPSVDSCGGLLISDWEVNQKVLLAELSRTGRISETEKTALLASTFDPVTDSIVYNCHLLNNVLSYAEEYSVNRLGEYESLISHLESRGYLDREWEGLPNPENLKQRIELGEGLTRPEIANLLGPVSNYLYDKVMESDILQDPRSEQYLLNYFPDEIAERFPNEIMRHPLAKEIKARKIVNSIIQHFEPTFVSRIATETGSPTATVIKTYLAAEHIFCSDSLINELRLFGRNLPKGSYYSCYNEIRRALDGVIRWLIESGQTVLLSPEHLDTFRDSFRKLFMDQGLSNLFRPRGTEVMKLESHDALLSDRLRACQNTHYFLDIIRIAEQCNRDHKEVAELFSLVLRELRVEELISRAFEVQSNSSNEWETNAARHVRTRIKRSAMKVTKAIIEELNSASPESLREFFQQRQEKVERYEGMYRELDKKIPSISGLMVISTHAAEIAQ